MRKIVYIHLIIPLLVIVFCEPVLPRFDYTEQVCPLSRYNIEKAEALLKEMEQIQEEAYRQGLYTRDMQAIIGEAETLLDSARIYSRRGTNCIAGNIFAIKAQRIMQDIPGLVEPLRVSQKEEYAIYSILIKERYSEGVHYLNRMRMEDHIENVVIIDHTSLSTQIPFEYFFHGFGRYIQMRMPEVEEETLSDFKIKNAEEYLIIDLFDIEADVTLVTSAKLHEIFQKGGWTGFYETFPYAPGILIFSKVGFNSDMTQALVIVGNSVDILWASGVLYFLVKEDDVWTIHNELLLWIS